jgi:hypothetical protein
VKTRRIVRNISMKRPRAMDVFGDLLKVVRTARGPGKSPYTTAAEAMAAAI